MNPDIERLAKEAGMDVERGLASGYYAPGFDEKFLSKFAALKAEECAKECEAQLADGECPERAQYCADAIREAFPMPKGEA